MTQAEYIEYLERFVDTKCEEVNSLIARLLRHQKYGDYDRQRLERAERAAQKHIELLNENRRLRGELASIQAAISQYAVRHRESKAERRTRELQELAAFRAESETARVDLYASILSELRQFADGIYDLDEHSVRKAVARAAQLLRETQVNCQ
jgi:hypothetical protein